MATKPTAKQDSARAMADELSDLVLAALMLDNWLVWMGDACGALTGNGGRVKGASLHFPHGRLPSTGASFGEEGDDGALVGGIRLMLEFVPKVSAAITSWGPRITGGTRSTIRSPLLNWRPIEHAHPANYFGWSDVPVRPTAHEATLEWFMRFLKLMESALSSQAANAADAVSDLARDLPLVFHHLVWNTEEASQLSVSMEQERRWLHDRVGRLFNLDLPRDDYERTWQRYDNYFLLAVKTASDLTKAQKELLQALHREEPQKKKELYFSTTGSRRDVSGTFQKTLNDLQELSVIRCGNPNRTSQGYELTLFGRYVSRLAGINPTTRNASAPTAPFRLQS